MGFAKFMSSAVGRLIRIVAGLALIAVGLLVVQGVFGVVIAVLGLAPVLAGVFNVCIFAPLFGGPFRGSDA